MNLDVVIPTYGRSGNQETLRQLVAAGINVTLVIQEREEEEHVKYLGPHVMIHVLPPGIMTIAPTRQFILENVGVNDAFVMVDDDLTFYHRREDDPTKLRDITPEELYFAFQRMANVLTLGPYSHVGFASREGANRNIEEVVENTRIMRVLGYNRATLKLLGIRFDDMEVMEDFHVALQLLEHGHPNVILNTYAHNQAGSGATGGCSHFRTPELHARNAERLATFHSSFVKVVEKTTKGAWGGGTRKDVNIQWKKAFASSGRTL